MRLTIPSNPVPFKVSLKEGKPEFEVSSAGLRDGLLRWGAIIAALHVAVLSVAMGPHCFAYVLAAYLTAVVVWGGGTLIPGRRWLALGVGLGLTVVVQQMAFRSWKAELADSPWPLLQFCALQLLIGAPVRRIIRHTLQLGVPLERYAQGKEGAGRSSGVTVGLERSIRDGDGGFLKSEAEGTRLT